MGSVVAVGLKMWQCLRTIASVLMALLYTGPEGFGASSNAMSIAFRQLLCVLPNSEGLLGSRNSRLEVLSASC